MDYYYLITSQRDLLENQRIEEILRERAAYFSNRNKQRNFWLVISPSFLYEFPIFEKFQLTQYYFKQVLNQAIKSNLNNENNSFFISLVSSDKNFIHSVGLRLGYFEDINNQEFLNNQNYRSNGIKGKFKEYLKKKNNKINYLKSYSNYFDSEILLEKNKKFLLLSTFYFSRHI